MKITTRDEALAQGLKRYFTGIACKHGHVAERAVANRSCSVCDAEKCRRRYQANPEAARQRTGAWRAKNPEKAENYQRRYRQENREERAASWRRYYEANKASLARSSREYREANREAVLEGQRAWREKNVQARAALEAKRRARKRNAVPGWFGELDSFVWQEAANLVILRREATGIDWAADHMIPLASKKACGLHVAANCQVIPATLNGFKHARMVLTERDEWLIHVNTW